MPRVRRRANFTQLSKFERGRIIGLREAGISFREIAYRVNRNQASVMRSCRAWFQEGRHRRAIGTGRQRQTTERQDRRLRLLALRDRFSTTRAIANHWFDAVGRAITMRTAYRRIRSFGLFSYRPHLVLPLTPEHRRQRLEWSRDRLEWNMERKLSWVQR